MTKMWFDQITLTPSPTRRRKQASPLRNSTSLPSISPKDLFDSLHQQTTPQVSQQIHKKRRRKETTEERNRRRREELEESKLAAAKVAMKAAEDSAKRLKEWRKKRQRKKRFKVITEKKEAETERQRVILEAIERKQSRVRKYCSSPSSIALSPRSNFKKRNKTLLSPSMNMNVNVNVNNKRPVLLHLNLQQFTEEAERYGLSGDPYIGIRKNIRKHRGVAILDDFFSFI